MPGRFRTRGSARVTGIEILPLAVLDRPRVDVTLRISGLFRDAFEAQVLLFDAAVRAIAARDEDAAWNPLAAAARGLAGDARRGATARVFGAPLGAYGAGVTDLVERGAWRQRDELGASYLAASAFAYGRDLGGTPDADGFAARVAAADAFVHPQDHREIDLLEGAEFAAHEGGFAAAADSLGNAPALYHLDTSQPELPRTRTLTEELHRIVRGRAANPAWIGGMMRHGYRGAAEIERSLEGLVGFAASLPQRLDQQFDLLFDATLGDPAVDAFLRSANPAARAAMVTRFRDAAGRDLWRPRRNAVTEILWERPRVNAIRPKGWCPSLYEPMASGDGLLVRVKPPGAVLTADAARQLGAAAEQYDNGMIELTSRAAIQVRGLSKLALAPFAAAMVAAGLADADPRVERRRAVIVPPLAGDNVRAVAAAVEARLVRDPRLTGLPAKFAVAVDGGGALALGDVGAHVQVACDGAACVVTLMASGDTVTVGADDVADAVARFARMLPDIGTRRPPAPRALKAIGWFSHGDGAQGAFGVGLPFGMTTAAVLISLARLAECYGDGTLRVTPWRAFVLPGVPAAAVTQLRDDCAAIELIVDPADPRLAVIACPGQPACASATVPARADAMRLATLGLPPTVHVSGCAKGCAHPGPARIALIGENGRYGIVRDGRPGDAPSARDLTIAQVISALSA